MSTIRVALVDDQAMFRRGVSMIVRSQPDLEVVGEAGNGEEAIALVDREHPDVVLMDVRMPVLDGVETTRRLLADGNPARVLVLTTFDLDEYVYRALRAGASGFLLKNAEPAELLRGIRLAVDGDALLAPSVTRRLIAEFAAAPERTAARTAALDVLTARAP